MSDLANRFLDSGYHNDYPFKLNYFDQGSFVQHYLDEGDSEEVIVMLHGNPTWSFYYRNLVKHFSKNFRVIVPDHMGCGFSSRPQGEGYTLKQHIQNTSNLLKHLNIDKFHLVVHDWGGAIGYGLAVKDPSRVKSIVTFNTAAFLSRNIPKRINILKHKKMGEFLIRGLNAFAWPATFMTTVKPLERKIKRAYLFPYKNYHDRIAIARFVQDIPMNKEHISYNTLAGIETKLKNLKMPKCFIWGMKDFCFDASFLRRFREVFPHEEFYQITDAGHYVIEDAPQKCLNFMKEFYRRVV